MTEQKLKKNKKNNPSVPGIRAADTPELRDFLKDFSYLIPGQYLETILGMYEYLRNLPENQIMVCAHNDLHIGNLFWNNDKKLVSVIDFEMSGYRSKLGVMYGTGFTNVADLWACVDGLPRTKNPDLNWNFDSDKSILYGTLRTLIIEMDDFLNGLSPSVDNPSFIDRVKRSCDVMLYRFDKIIQRRPKKKTMPRTLVLLNQYSR